MSLVSIPEITIEELDRNVSLSLTMWAETALLRPRPGQRIAIHDSCVAFNKEMNFTYVNVNYADNVIVSITSLFV